MIEKPNISVIFATRGSPFSISAGKGGEEMEGRVVGTTEEDDGGKAAACRVKTRAATPGHCEEGSRRRGQGKCDMLTITKSIFNVALGPYPMKW